MIEPLTETLVRELLKHGTSQRKIAKQLGISRNTVGKIVAGGDNRPAPLKVSSHEQHLTKIKELFGLCEGNVVRVQEELAGRYNIEIPYQSLTWLIRKYEMRTPVSKRAGRYTFAPGEEMQHDTSPHKITLGGKSVTAQCAALTFAYSSKVFMQYYPRFTRFECKVFLDAAFAHMQGSCGRCVVDNTSVIIAYGTGPDAVMTPEMERFGRIYGFYFMAHRIKHADRKARVERPFHYAEHNFLAGRTFTDWHDLNYQAVEWCNNVANHKPKKRLGMSAEAAYLMEKNSLRHLPKVPPPVYVAKQRIVDVEGYIHLDTNRYSVPEKLLGKSLEVHKYWDRIDVYYGRELVAKHQRVLQGRDKRITAPGHHLPLNRKKAFQGKSNEEKCLAGHDPILDSFIVKLKQNSRGRGLVKLRKLLDLKRSYPEKPFMKAIQNANKYGLFDLTRVENMILSNTRGDYFKL
jgi:transposase